MHHCRCIFKYTHKYTYIISIICIYIYICIIQILYRAISKNPCSIPTPGVRGSYDFLELGQQPLILEAKEFEFPDAPSGFFTYMVRDPTKTSRGLHTYYKDSLLQVDDHPRYDLKLVLEHIND